MKEIKTLADFEHLMLLMDEGDKTFAQYILYQHWPSLHGLIRQCLTRDSVLNMGRIAYPFDVLPKTCSALTSLPGVWSRESKTLLILHNQDCDQFGDITGESPQYLWFSCHGGYFKMEKDTGEVETLKPAEF